MSCGVGVLGALALIPINRAMVPGAPVMAELAGLVLPAMLITDALSGYLLAAGRVSTFNKVQALNPVAGLGAMAILVIAAGLGLSGAIVGWMTGQCLATVAALVACRHILRDRPSERGAWKVWGRPARQILWFAFQFGLVGAVSVVNYRIDLFLLRGFHTVHDVGIYSLSVSLAELGWVLPTSLITAATPAIVNAAGDREAAWLVARASRFSVMLSTASSVVLAIGAVVLLPDVFGRAFRASTYPLLVLLPGVVVFSSGTPLDIYVSLRKGRVTLTGALALLSAVVTAIVGVAVIPSLSSIGAAMASTAGYVATTLTTVVVFARITGVPLVEFLPRLDDYRYVRALLARQTLVQE
jgi:O-antigen/teichoic acid export membrane protein